MIDAIAQPTGGIAVWLWFPKPFKERQIAITTTAFRQKAEKARTNLFAFHSALPYNDSGFINNPDGLHPDGKPHTAKRMAFLCSYFLPLL